MVGAKMGIALQINHTLGLNIPHPCKKVTPPPLSLIDPPRSGLIILRNIFFTIPIISILVKFYNINTFHLKFSQCSIYWQNKKLYNIQFIDVYTSQCWYTVVAILGFNKKKLD